MYRKKQKKNNQSIPESKMEDFLDVPQLGDQFPQVEVQTTHGKIILPEHYSGKWWILFSHPADFTPVCTTEFIGFAKRQAAFQELNTEMIGLSVDQVFSHIKWIEWIENNFDIKIPFPVIADDMGILAEELNMLHEEKGSNTVRTVFVIDPEASIRLMLYYPQEVGRNIDEILRAVEALQVADTHKVATPHNWPNNDMIGRKVILPPAQDIETAEKRKKEYEHFDWWFAYKDLEE
jgi:peroxiredoxin (alkyl hydroperoxide reductase subunit C)